MANSRPKVGLFVTCLADLIRPRTAFAALTLLRRAGCEVEAPAQQTCCGQPAYNSGDRGDAEDSRKNSSRRSKPMTMLWRRQAPAWA